MLETNAPQPKTLQRVCIRCGDANAVSLSQCPSCGFDLTSDLQRDYDFYRDGVPLDAPTGVGERQAQRDAATIKRRARTEPGVGHHTWRPYRDVSEAVEETGPTAQATMDLGAAVLEAVFHPTSKADNSPDDEDLLSPLMVEVPERRTADPVGWTPTKAMRVEPAVIIGTDPSAPESDCTEEESPLPAPVVGVVHDWSASPIAETLLGTPEVSKAPSRPVMASHSVTYAPSASPPYPTPESVAVTTPEMPSAESTTETLLTEAVVKLEPVSQRNHIRRGATTYIDAVQGSVRRSPTGWLPRDAALPLAIATGLVTLVLFALM